ncbi:MAG TPA: hypothetical protein VEA38_06085 [Terriglobales bacterium]|nr:hypothetical protein [Terriglobales bacterium]
MPDVERIDAHAARREVSAGRAWLVCAYDDRQRCRSMMLEGAIDMDELEARLPTAPKDQPMVFYCA